MTDWSPLGLVPVQGSPDTARAQASEWREVASRFDAAATALGLEQRGIPSIYTGPDGAAALDRALAGQQDPMRQAGALLIAAATALDDYATDLAGRQAQAALLATAAGDLARQLAEDFRQLKAQANPVSQLMSVVTEDHQRLAADVAAAGVRLDRLRQDAARLHELSQTAAQHCATRLLQLQAQLRALPERRVLTAGSAATAGMFAGSLAYHRLVEQLAGRTPDWVNQPRSREQVAAAWNALDPRLQAELIALYPVAVGNTDGIPAADRDRANRVSVRTDVDLVAARLRAVGLSLPESTADPADYLDRLRNLMHQAGFTDAQIGAYSGALSVHHALAHPPTGPTGAALPLQVLTYEPTAFDGRGRAAIAVGNVETADTLTVLNTGMGSNVATSIVGQVGRAGTLYRAEQQVTGPQQTAAVIAYIGTRGPGPSEVVTQRIADEDAPVLAADIEAYSALRADPENSRLVVAAFSYGSTIAATAFAKYGAKADSLVFIGSPGAGRARSVKDFTGVPPGQVYVLANSADPVTTLAQQLQDPGQADKTATRAAVQFVHGKSGDKWETVIAGGLVKNTVGPLMGAVSPELGVDPAGADFGAIRLTAENGSADQTDLGNHASYWEPGSSAMTNLAAVASGNPGAADYALPRPNTGDHFTGYDPEAHK